jgi:polyisoprenoid-binding protein YceI
MTFASTGVVEKGPSELVVTGDLTIKGVTKPLELAVEVLGEGGDPWGGTRVGVEASGQISRKEFGIDFNIPLEGDKVMIGDRISIVINAEAVLQG